MRFSNQDTEQIIKHLSNYLNENFRYDLIINVNPQEMEFIIRRSMKKRSRSEKRIINGDMKNLRKRQRRLVRTKKRTRPKIRSVKRGRTVELKGRVY
ncbi:MAG: hypothetical protein DRO90_00585 [Candidatus Altiarchaeales archaeon]|nr:MAG: hypothetical protein DRO94_02225 [Candidatus Altiarchaeales archaeon]RLI95273.1 MAG: hypothetical protein DRO90_00585 [Candidatus Altiarchaeales archaeon]